MKLGGTTRITIEGGTIKSPALTPDILDETLILPTEFVVLIMKDACVLGWIT